MLLRSKKRVSLVCLSLLQCLPFVSFFFNLSFSCHVEMTTKFNQEMYAKIKARKNRPLLSLGKKVVRVVKKGTPITPTTSIPKVTRTAFPSTSLEEITPCPKRQRTAGKGKKKVGSQASNV